MERPDPVNEEQPQTEPIPPDAPVETPEADPRTQGAPDPQEPGTHDAGDEDPDTESGRQDVTEEQIGEAFR
jgi:hypothetical protein